MPVPRFFMREHPNPERIQPVTFDHDGPVHADESVEVFLDPGTEGNIYFHFMANTAGVKREQRVTAGNKDPKWNGPWRFAAKVNPKGWDAEMAVPLYVFSSLGDLSGARINICRNAVIPTVDAQGLTVGESREFSCWSPVATGFHEPPNFGIARGFSVGRVNVPFLAAFEGVRAGAYYVREGRTFYDVCLALLSASAKEGTVRVSVVDQPRSGPAGTVSRDESVPKSGRKSVTIPVPVSVFADRTVTVRMEDVATGEVLQTVRVTDTSAFRLMSVYLDRSYYTTEKEALAVCSFGFPEQVMKDSRMVVKDAKGRILASRRAPAQETRLSFPLAKMPAGSHALRVQLLQKDGTAAFDRELSLLKRVPKPGYEVKVDRISKVLLRDGKPFFPFGVLFASKSEEQLKKVADAGCNTVVNWNFWEKPEDAGVFVDMAGKYGLQVVEQVEGYGKGCELTNPEEYLAGEALERARKAARTSFACLLKGFLATDPEMQKISQQARSRIFADHHEKNRPRYTQAVSLSRQRPNVLAFNTTDEPFGKTYFDMYKQGQDYYRFIHELDGYRPVFTLWGAWPGDDPDLTNWTDILVADPYWIPADPASRNGPNYVTKVTIGMKRGTDRDRLVPMNVPVGELWSGMHKRIILPAEQRCQTYLSVIHGAKGVPYFCYPFTHPLSWDTVSALAKEMQVLGPAVVSPDVPQNIAYSPGKLDPQNEEYPDVQACLMNHPDLGYLLVAANSRPYAVDTTFSLSCLRKEGSVRRLFAEQSPPVKMQSFSDRLEPYGTRAYALGVKETPGTTDVRVAMVPDPATALNEKPAYNHQGRPGKKNVLPNPGFKEATVPEWPGYYKYWYIHGQVGSEVSGLETDPANVHGGKVSLRIGKKEQGSPGVYFYIAPRNDRDRRYVFSAWLKADRPGVRVSMQSDGFETKTFTVGKSWQRCWVTGTVPAMTASYGLSGIRVLDEATVWMDTLQFEPGEAPTDFEP